MNSHRAREILLRHRPGTPDDHDPEVRAALEQAARDPELAKWLEDHQHIQRHVQGELRSIQPPPGLKEQILSEKRAALGPWIRPARTVLAAAVALLAVVVTLSVVLRPDPEEQFATFRSRMVRTALRGYAMDLETANAVEIRRYLADQGGHADWQGPAGLDVQPLLGCAVLVWRSNPATMICYGSRNTPDLWLFVVDNDALPDPPADDAGRFARVNRINTVSWSHQGRTYVLASDRPEEELRRLAAREG